MNLRKIVFWTHLCAGCVAGAIIFLMSVTGVLLTYERQMLALVERGPHRHPPEPGARRLEPEDLLAALRQQRGEVPRGATIVLRADPAEPVEIGLGREGSLYLSPSSGQILGRSSQNARAFFRTVTSWHRWLGADGNGPGRTAARAVTGACNLAFLVLIVTGAYLWIPRQWNWRSLRPVTWFRRGLSGRARDFNWHNVFGLWALAPLFLVVLTAVPMSYSWANDLLYRWTGTQPPQRPGPPQRSGPPASGTEATGLNALWARAAAQMPSWVSISAPALAPREGPVSFMIDTGDGGQPQQRATLTLDRATASVLRWETFADANAGRRLRTWSRFIHTGEAFGLIGQTVAGLASAAGAMLVWTGISLAVRRWLAWNRRRRQTDDSTARTEALVS
jgi:uncharacterized iron-regulated membrane protein